MGFGHRESALNPGFRVSPENGRAAIAEALRLASQAFQDHAGQYIAAEYVHICCGKAANQEWSCTCQYEAASRAQGHSKLEAGIGVGGRPEEVKNA